MIEVTKELSSDIESAFKPVDDDQGEKLMPKAIGCILYYASLGEWVNEYHIKATS